MYSILTSFSELAECFDFIDATPADYPGRFEFCLPNKLAVQRWTNWPAAARPENGRAAAGRGWTRDQCRISGLGEAIELASVCDWGNEDLVFASQSELGERAIPASAILGFSEAEYQTRDDWNAGPFGELDWRPREQTMSEPIDWFPARTNDGEQVFIPADLVLVGRRETGDQRAIGIATTSGCAAGATFEDAAERALLEVLERDAIGLWWYGAKPARPLPLGEALSDSVIQELMTSRDRPIRIFDISTDLFRHVVVAASWEPSGGSVALGFAANIDRNLASRSAVLELLQTEIGLEQRRAINDPLVHIWLREVTENAPQFQETSESLTELSSQTLRYFLCDLSRSEFNVPVLRAICTDLATDKPRHGSSRLSASDRRRFCPLLV